MNKELIYITNEMISLGAKFVKHDYFDIFFIIPKDSKLNDKELLLQYKRLIQNSSGLILKVKYT